MPPPPSQRAEIEPPDEITHEGIRGFLHGAFKFASTSILLHMLMNLPHPIKVSPSATGFPAPMQPETPPRRPSPFSGESLKSRLFYRPMEGFSEWLSPASRIYRGLTPQFKVYLQISAMTLGGVVYAEHRVNDYINTIRKVKRAERLHSQREADMARYQE
ncbi:uncharacterized protein BDV17DRAFT_269331, partial [Aspergillus undulatus]|uniref:uncharacterized protein n=1 Tax=Aspergillus undulatus TaxID=1810928 RepID=UPI003CCD7763